MQTEKEIWRQELQAAEAKHLLDWDGKSIFNLPHTYFETFQQKLQDNLADEEVFLTKSVLAHFQKHEPFEAPTGYFETLGERLQEKIKGPQIRNLRTSWQNTRIAAAILILITGSWLIFSPPIQSGHAFENLTEAELAAFISTEGIDAYTLAEVFDISQLELPSVSPLTEDEINDFLEENDWNEQDLEELMGEEI